jgi:translation initiation factor IF-2
MPQTDEALKHIQNAKVALIVAVNKMDMKGANLDRVKAQMQERGIPPEDWGGETITVPTAAVKGPGHQRTPRLHPPAGRCARAEGQPEGRGLPASSSSPRSTSAAARWPRSSCNAARSGPATPSCAAPNFARVRAMFDDRGETVKEAAPSTPVKIIGWSGTPDSGATFKSVKNAREAERLAEEEQAPEQGTVTLDSKPKDVSVEKLFAEIAASQQKTLRVVLKCDVFGSIEAVRNILDGIKSQKVSLEIVSGEVGLIGKNDVLMAGAAGADHHRFQHEARERRHAPRQASRRAHRDLRDHLRAGRQDPRDDGGPARPGLKEVKLGAAEVRATFPLAKGFVAGCLVTEGKVPQRAAARLRRGREILCTRARSGRSSASRTTPTRSAPASSAA